MRGGRREREKRVRLPHRPSSWPRRATPASPRRRPPAAPVCRCSRRPKTRMHTRSSERCTASPCPAGGWSLQHTQHKDHSLRYVRGQAKAPQGLSTFYVAVNVYIRVDDGGSHTYHRKEEERNGI